MSNATLELLQVAKWYKTNPSLVERWPITKFYDREEYMFYSEHLASRSTDSNNGLGPGEKLYEGPKKNG